MPSILCCVVDLCGHGWASLPEGNSIVDAMAIGLNAYRLLNTDSSVVIMAAGAESTDILWPQASSSGDRPNFQKILSDAFSNAPEGTVLQSSLLAAALARAFCYINKLRSGDSGSGGQRAACEARLLVFKSGLDRPAQRMSLLNVLYSAQKHKIIVDCLAMGSSSHSGLLQQACDMAGGVYLPVDSAAVLLQAMLSVVCASNELRQQLVQPSPRAIDLRPACFCHQKPIDKGFVCSICLSVYCQFTPLCQTCQAVYTVQPPLGKTRKKKPQLT